MLAMLDKPLVEHVDHIPANGIDKRQRERRCFADEQHRGRCEFASQRLDTPVGEARSYVGSAAVAKISPPNYSLACQ